MNKIWVVSLVYSKQLETKINHSLRSVIIYAENKDEALGIGIRLIGEEFIDQHWSLYLRSVIEVSESKEPLNA